jgi:hypothetical protein
LKRVNESSGSTENGIWQIMSELQKMLRILQKESFL